MNLKAINQNKLFGYDDLFYNFVNLLKNNILPHRIIISGPKGSGKSTFAYHFINFILSQKEENNYFLNDFEISNNNKSFNLVKNLVHPNFHLIELSPDKKNIEISQVRNAISYTHKSTFNNNFKIVLIDNIESLNKNSVNALLKTLEEANENLFFILIHDNAKKILDTIKSRCVIFKKQFSFDQNVAIVNKILNVNIFDYLNKAVLNHYLSISDLLFLYNFSKENDLDLTTMDDKKLLMYLINQKNIKKDPIIKNITFKYIQSFLHSTYLKTKNTNIISMYQYFMNKIDQAEKYNLDLDSLILEFKNKAFNE